MTKASPAEFVAAVKRPVRRSDAEQLLACFARIIGMDVLEEIVRIGVDDVRQNYETIEE